MLARFSRQRLKNAFGAIGACLLLGLAACLASDDAIAQEAAPSTAPTTDSTTAEHHHAKADDAARHAHSTVDTATADKTASHDHPAGQHADRNHAAEQQQALHAEIQKKFKEFDAAFKKTTIATTARAHRPPRTDAKVDHAQGQPPSPTAGTATPNPGGNPQIVAQGQPLSPTASAATATPGGNPRIAVHNRPAPATIPAPVREASVSAPTNPHGPKPMLTPLGGRAPYDPKKGPVLSGNTMRRRL